MIRTTHEEIKIIKGHLVKQNPHNLRLSYQKKTTTTTTRMNPNPKKEKRKRKNEIKRRDYNDILSSTEL